MASGYPTVEQGVPPGADAVRDRQNVLIGPFLSSQIAADTTVKTGAGVVGNFTVSNLDASAKTINVYDATSGTSNPIEQVYVPATSSVNVQVNAEFFTGLRFVSASWANLLVSVRFR